MSEQYHLVILLTGGIDDDEPSVWGKHRIEKAYRLAIENDCRILVVGGKRLNGPSEAMVYSCYLDDEYSFHRASVSAEGTMTAADLRLAAGKLEYLVGRGQRIAVVSSRRHAKRAILTLEWLGYNNCHVEDSGEPMSDIIPPWKENVLWLITWLDPGFTWLGKRLLAYDEKKRLRGDYDKSEEKR